MFKGANIEHMLAMIRVAALSSAIGVAVAATTDIMEGALVSIGGPFEDTSGTYKNALIDGGYNNYAWPAISANNVAGIEEGSTENTISLNEQSTFVTVFINNSCFNDAFRQYMGESELLVGNDPQPWSTINQVVYEKIYDGGFFQIQLTEPVKYVTIRRKGKNPANESNFYLSEMRVYEDPNLLQTVGVKITTDTSNCYTGYAAENLITNLDNRSCSPNFNPLIGIQEPSTAYNSCL